MAEWKAMISNRSSEPLVGQMTFRQGTERISHLSLVFTNAAVMTLVFSVSKAVTVQMEMPAHKASFFSISKLMSMNHRLIGKSVPIPALLFSDIHHALLCCIGTEQQESRSPADESWQGPRWLWQTFVDIQKRPWPTVFSCHAPEKNTHKQAEKQHNTTYTNAYLYYPYPASPNIYAYSFIFWLDHARTVRLGF